MSVPLKKMKKKTLKLVAAEMLNKRNLIKFESREWDFYNSTLVVIDTKLYKPKQTEKNHLNTSVLFKLTTKL